MLDNEAREGIRRSAELLSSVMTDEEREAVGQKAHRLIDNLHETFDDENAASAAYLVAALMAALNSVQVRYLSKTLQDSMDTYLLAAGRLAGVYTLPERKDGSDEEQHPEVLRYEPGAMRDDAPSPGTGFYL